LKNGVESRLLENFIYPQIQVVLEFPNPCIIVMWGFLTL